MNTPPIPDHDSAHAVEGATAAQVMKRLLGDHVHFATCSLTLPAGITCSDPNPVLRTYNSFWRWRKENGVSRILVGFHFRHAVNDGLRPQVGDRAATATCSRLTNRCPASRDAGGRTGRAAAGPARIAAARPPYPSSSKEWE